MSTIHVAVSPPLYRTLFAPEVARRLDALGEVSYDGARRAGPDELTGYDIVVTGWDSPRLPDRLPPGARLKLVSHSAGTVRPYVPASLLGDGVRVVQAAAGMATAVAEFALTLCLCLLRNVHSFDRAMVGGGDWSVRDRLPLGAELAEQRVGVVGASRVGRAFIRMVRALGAPVTVADPYLSAADAAALDVTAAPLHQVLAGSDVIAVHAPVTDETRGMIGKAELALVRDGGILVNTARSAVLDEPALVDELIAGRLRAGLDVYDTEPLPLDSPLYGLPNVLLTPHQAGASVQSRYLQGRIAVDEITRYLAGEPLQHEVTAEAYDRLA